MGRNTAFDILVPLMTYILTSALLHEVNLPVVPVSDVVPAIAMLYVLAEPPSGQPESTQLPSSMEKPPVRLRTKTALPPVAVPSVVTEKITVEGEGNTVPCISVAVPCSACILCSDNSKVVEWKPVLGSTIY